ncbi:putative histidine kinase HHK7p [Macroventuria anomochaeta]|uniref:Histidine kinase HHK7p n=1 Tax=Macroventuria anomochaeta TaxID=301207 RepID=A0ACB6RUW6_9PLEO|nr:putative histidine kinase HHK7p [Macroventuria anomochaeta]KAF2625578.1 putative histidine kinase HHK7p [Macroventuria anomochaeta]
MSRPPPASRIKPLSEKKREREVLQYVAAYRDLPHLEGLAARPESSHLPVDHHARPSTDSTLTALCQLAALRMNAQRALVSLIDDTCQHILAEATPRSSLRGVAPPGDGSNSLWLGSVSIPRSWGVCEQVLGLDTGKVAAGKGTSVIINKDLLDSDQYAQRTYVRDGPQVRFYAGAALVSPHGAIVGALCVFDDAPRPVGIPDEDVTYLEDLSATIVEYLGNYTVRDRFKRGEKLTRGLISFAEGASALLPLDSIDQLNSEPRSPTTTTSSTSGSNVEPRSSHNAPTEDHPPSQAPETTYAASQASQAGSQGSGQNSLRQKQQQYSTALQDTILPRNSKSMFARAANVMLASSDLDGVLILDASIAATGHRQHPAAPQRERLSGSLSDATESAGLNSKSESSEDSSSHSSTNRNPNSSSSSKMSETNLARLLRAYPHGKVFNYTATGISMSSTDDSSSYRSHEETLPGGDDTRPTATRKNTRASRSSKAISELLVGARSVAFVPFWDYERSRWFAGCLCWTNNPDRLLSVSVDLAYFNIFSHSIMRELSRLDAVALNQQKTTFVASISHELRSPLHGILGTLEFIKDTPLDTFQTSMLNSLNSCGQTLLDTINHVMDHSKMSETTNNVSTRRLKNTKTVRLSSKPLKTRRLRDPAFDLGIATEEVVEAVFAGSSFLPIMSLNNVPLSPTESTSASLHTDVSEPTTKRKTCYIILDVAHEQDWIYCFPVGSWKRTVMNIFGNAVKYTQTGHITVSLHATDAARTTGSATTITLTVTDTGTGMSPAFLANKAFQPFSQENPHSSGVGLGLSIIRQIIETNGGKIEVSSDHSFGTKITVKLSLIRPETAQIALPQRNEYLSLLPRLKGRRICILHRAESNQDLLDEPQNAEGLAKFTRALTTTLANHLEMDVVQTTKWEGNNADLVICPEPSFDYLASIRHQRADTKASKAAVTIFVALDALEAATLRSDVRVKNKESVVEILTQPLGPHKLAYVLNKCLDRLKHPDENVQPASNLTHISTPNLSQPPSVERSITLSPSPILSPPPVEMPPLKPLPTASKILITDDNAINRRLLVAFTKKYNLQYAEAENGLEALRAYQSSQVQFDVILMDMSMPVMDGMSATRAIRQYEQEYNVPRCCIIALTGLASASAKLEAWNSGIDHFMTKPVNFKALEKFLKKEEVRHDGGANKEVASASAPASAPASYEERNHSP